MEGFSDEHCRALRIWAVSGAALLLIAAADPALALNDGAFGVICGRALNYLEHGFGALLSAVAGMGAIIASASGGFRTAWSLLIVSIGAFILREYVGIFFSGMCQ